MAPAQPAKYGQNQASLGPTPTTWSRPSTLQMARCEVEPLRMKSGTPSPSYGYKDAMFARRTERIAPTKKALRRSLSVPPGFHGNAELGIGAQVGIYQRNNAAPLYGDVHGSRTGCMHPVGGVAHASVLPERTEPPSEAPRTSEGTSAPKGYQGTERASGLAWKGRLVALNDRATVPSSTRSAQPRGSLRMGHGWATRAAERGDGTKIVFADAEGENSLRMQDPLQNARAFAHLRGSPEPAWHNIHDPLNGGHQYGGRWGECTRAGALRPHRQHDNIFLAGKAWDTTGFMQDTGWSAHCSSKVC